MSSSPTPLRILAVDDEPDFLRLVEIFLAPVGCELRFASDGVQALEVLASFPAEIVLVDLQMPRMGGKELLRQVRLRYPSATAVVMTAYGDEEVAVEVLQELGAADYVPKTSLTEKRLLRVVEHADLERRAAALASAGEFDVLRAKSEGPVHLVAAGALVADPKFRRFHCFEAGLAAPLSEGAKSAVVDLRFLSALVPAALGKAVALRRRYQEAGGDLVLASPAREVVKVVELFDAARIPGGLGLAVAADLRTALQTPSRR
jgi:CheY-like chemotaxis protein